MGRRDRWQFFSYFFIEAHLDSDVVFGVNDELIFKIEKRSDNVMPDGRAAEAPWHLMTYDFRNEAG